MFVGERRHCSASLHLRCKCLVLGLAAAYYPSKAEEEKDTREKLNHCWMIQQYCTSLGVLPLLVSCTHFSLSLHFRIISFCIALPICATVEAGWRGGWGAHLRVALVPALVAAMWEFRRRWEAFKSKNSTVIKHRFATLSLAPCFQVLLTGRDSLPKVLSIYISKASTSSISNSRSSHSMAVASNRGRRTTTRARQRRVMRLKQAEKRRKMLHLKCCWYSYKKITASSSQSIIMVVISVSSRYHYESRQQLYCYCYFPHLAPR